MRHEPNITGSAFDEQMIADWLAHARGCRKRAFEYKRLAIAYERDGNLKQYRDCRKRSDQQWRMALDAMVHARRDFDFIKGASKWH